MFSVTQLIKMIKQPYGGFIPASSFFKYQLENEEELFTDENVHASLIGLSVDYLTRFMLGKNPMIAFKISILGSEVIKQKSNALRLLKNINGLDDKSIRAAIKLSAYDVCYRASVLGFKPPREIKPNKNTITNVRIMVNRGLEFFGRYGPITSEGFTFEGGYTDTVSSGDGDFTTKDTIWDFKVSKNHPKKEHTLQLLMYYLMGLHSVHEEFKNIKNLGIFNPRKNLVYTLAIDSLDSDMLTFIENGVIGYKLSQLMVKSEFREFLVSKNY
jgi:hypothetical protein